MEIHSDFMGIAEDSWEFIVKSHEIPIQSLVNKRFAIEAMA